MADLEKNLEQAIEEAMQPNSKAEKGDSKPVKQGSSDAAKIGNPGQANYVATKSAIEGLTRTIANEVASRGITVNAVSPGFIETDIIESVNKERLETMLKKVPVGRIGSTEEVASLVYFLSSEESSYITGQVIHINGGLTM